MKKRALALLLVICTVFQLLPVTAFAATVASGTCGDNATWKLTSDGTLTISGTGPMTDYAHADLTPWYDNQSMITSIIIDKGITRIGDSAFRWTRASSVTIPGSVTSIGELAFDTCNYLTGVTIPNSVKTIGDHAFNGCNDMTSLSLGSGVTTIGDYAFSSTGLTSVTIPDSVSSIGTGVFYNCHDLKKISVSSKNAYYCNDSRGVLFNKQKTMLVGAPGAISGSYTIPDSVTDIGDEAFFNCEKLTGLTIPAGIVSVGERAIGWCESLEEIVFLGDAPTFAEDTFYETTTTAYYPDNNTTWTADVMQDYGGTITWVDGLRQIGWKPDPRAYTVVVAKATSNMRKATLISGVKATLTEVNATSTGLYKDKDTTNSQGQVRFETMLVKPEPTRLWIEKSGYKTIQTVINLVRNDGSVYMMEKAPKDKPYVTCSVVSYSSGGTQYADLRYEPLGMAEGTAKKITTMFRGNWNGCGSGKFVLYQDFGNSGIYCNIDSSGKLTFSPGQKFKEGYPIYLQMIAKDGTKSDPIRVDLRIYSSDAMLNDVAGPGEMKWLTDQKLSSNHKLFKDILQMGLSISSMAVDLEITTADTPDYLEYMISVGGTVLKDAKDLGNAKKDVKNWKKDGDVLDVAKQMSQKVKSSRVKAMITGDVNVGGYVYVKLNKKTLAIPKWDAGIVVSASAETSVGRTWVTPVGIPVFMEINAGLSGKMYGSYTKSQIQSAISLINGTPTDIILPVPVYDEDLSKFNIPEVSVEGGVGVRNLMTVGANGKVKHEMVIQDGELGGAISSTLSLHAYLLYVLDKTYDFLETEPIVSWGSLKDAKTLRLYSSGEEDILNDDAESMDLISRDYLNGTSEWVGTPVTMLNEGDALAALQTGVMPDVIPQIHTVGDKQIMLFLQDSGARSIGNHTQLVYSVQENGTWSEPVAVWETDTADFYFDSVVEDGRLCVAWQKSDTVLEETDPVELLNAVAASSEIAYAVWDNDAGAFTNQQFLTDNDQMDLMASVAMDGGDAVVVWATTGTDVLGGTGDYTLNQIRVEDGVAGTAEELCTTDKYIVELCAGVTDSGVQTAWITSETDGTSELYGLEDGAPALVAAEGNFAGLSFHKDGFMVQNNGALYSFVPATGERNQLLGEDMAVSSSYQYVRNGETESIVWYRSGETGNLMASVYSDGAWQAPVVLLDEITDNITFMDAAVNEYGQYLVVANTADFDENGAENTALKFTCITPAKELELVGANVSDADWENNTQEITLFVENTGFFPVAEVTVDVTAGDTVCLSKTVSVDLQSGESCSITEMLDITGIETLIDADVQVSAEGDTDETNNTDVVTLGYADVGLEVDPMLYDDYEIFILKAENASNTDANVTLTVREDNEEGPVVETIDLGVVSAEEPVQYWYSVDASTVDFGDSDHKTYYFIISTDVEDLSDLDDSCLGVVDMPAGDGEITGEIVEIEIVEPESVEILNGDIVIPGVESEGVQLEAQVTPADETEFDWYAEDTTIVHVTSDGFVIPLNPGTTTVTAAVADGISDSITVTVEDVAHVHTEEIVEGIGATCTENGLTDGCICSVCLETLSEHRVIPAAGHSISGDPTFVWAEDYSTCNAVRTCGTCGESVGAACEIASTTTPATEDQAGAAVYTATVELDGQTYTDTKTVEIPATGHVKHTTTLVHATESDCTDSGNTAYYTCSGCDLWFEDAEATVVVEDHDSVIIPALGHSYESIVTAPTCTGQGYTTHTCSACGDSYADAYVDATGHSYSGVSVFAWGEGYETCTAGFVCGVCGEETTVECDVTSHSEDATCTEPGIVTYTAAVTMNGVTYTDERTVEKTALGHLAGEPVRENEVPASCASEGSYEEVVYCERCGVEISRVKVTVDKLAHTEETVPGKDATCTEPGLTDGKKCDLCGETLVAQEEIPALGHSYEDGFCTVCGEADPDYEEPTEPTETDPTEPSETVPSTPVKPSVPSWGSWLRKIWEKILEPIKPFLPGFGGWR